MFSFSTDNRADAAADADTDTAPDSDSEDYDTDDTLSPEDVQGVLEEANAGMKPGLGDKSIIAYQAYDEDDVSRHMILDGKSRFLFLKNMHSGASFIVQYTGVRAVEGQTPGDLFKPNTIKRCHLTALETRGLEKTFQTQPDGVVSLRNHAQRTEWRERLVTYSILLESNMFSPSIDIVGTDEKQTFLYNFVVATSPLSRMSIARKFKRDMDMPLLDVGTIAQPPAKRRRKSSTKDLLEAAKQLGNKIVTLKPAPKPEPAFDAAQGVAAAQQLDFKFVTLTPATDEGGGPWYGNSDIQEFAEERGWEFNPSYDPSSNPYSDLREATLSAKDFLTERGWKFGPLDQSRGWQITAPEPEAFEPAQGVAAARDLGFDFVTLAPATGQQEAPTPAAPAEQTEPSFTVGQGLEAAKGLGFKIVTLKKQ